MHQGKTRKFIAGILSAALTVSASTAALTPLTVLAAGNICGESTFDFKMLPWHTFESAPAKQDFQIEDGAVHIRIITAKGPEEQWDLQFRHRKLDFTAGHTYKVSFSARASRDGLKINSYIGDTGEPYNQYCTLKKEGFVNGPHMDGGGQGWGQPVELTTEWQTFEGTFECTEDLRAKEWTFHYAYGEKGNAKDGDEIWFDNMSIFDNNGCILHVIYSPIPSRYYSELAYNYISVNQLGYITHLAKIATLSDDKGDFLPHSEKKLTLSGTYQFELVDAKTGDVVYTGETGEPCSDPDSGDTVCKIDFTDFQKPGRYYLRIQGKEWCSFAFDISDRLYTDRSNNLLTNALNYFYQNRSGLDIESDYITSGDKSNLSHRGGHKTDKAFVQTEWKDFYANREEASETYASSQIAASGGWYSAGSFDKYMTEGGMAVWTLQNMYERALDSKKFDESYQICKVPETGNCVPDILDECRYELDFMQQMKVDASEPTWGKYAGLYYHKIQEQKWTGLAVRPWNYEEEWETVRIVKPPTFAATLNFAACAAQAARLWSPYDSELAASYFAAAKEAYAAAKKYYYEADRTDKVHPQYKTRCAAEEINPVSLYAPFMQEATGLACGDDQVEDEFYWAACELFITAKEMEDPDAAKYLKALSDYEDAFTVPDKVIGEKALLLQINYPYSLSVFDSRSTGAAGSFSLALHTDLLNISQKRKLSKSILEVADQLLSVEEKQGYGIPYQYEDPYGSMLEPNRPYYPSIVPVGYEPGSNAKVLSNMIAMAYAYDLTGEDKYANGVLSGMDYLLGNNPLSFSFITGCGSYRVYNPVHKYWTYELDDTLPLAPDGVVVSGPTKWLNKYMRAAGLVYGDTDASQRCFVDSVESASNAVSLTSNASLAWIVSFLQFDDLPDHQPETTEPQTGTSAEVDVTVWGDATGDSTADVADAVLLARYLTQDTEAVITDQGKRNANIVRGSLDTDDLSALLRYIAKKYSAEQFPLDSLSAARS